MTLQTQASPPALPFLGHAPALLKGPLRLLDYFTKTQNQIGRLNVLGSEMVVLTERAHFHECLLVKSKIYGFPDLYKNMAEVIGSGITATPDGSVWKKKRMMLQPKFGPRTVGGFSTLFANHAEDTFTSLRDGDPTNLLIHRISMNFALSSIFLTLCSTKFSGQAELDLFREVSEIVSRRFWMPPFLLKSKISPSGRKLIHHLEKLDAFVYDMISQRHALPPDMRPQDFLTFLIENKDLKGEPTLTAQEIRDEILNFIFAGYETTACLLTWSLVLLAKNQNYLAQVQAEIATVASLNSLDDFQKCKMISAVIQETMRLYPPVWMMVRQATQDDLLCDAVHVKKGQRILVSPYILHRMESLWKDATSYRPERFLGISDITKLPYFPFGHGPRHCMGSQFATLEATAFLFYFLKNFDLDPIKQLPEAEPTLTLQPPIDLRMAISRISL
jgi:cytochrome P450